MCLYPKLIKNRKYIANKKNGGIIPPVSDNRTLLVPVGCGKCMECKKQKCREWQVRLSEDIKHHKNGKFITLTFSNESIKELYSKINGLQGYELDNEIATLAVRRFLERWRKKEKKSVRHWFITELGGNGTENIHLHGIIWTNKNGEEISKKWKYGRISIGQNIYHNGKKLTHKNDGYVSEKTINYIIKYVNKIDNKHPNYNSKILTSSGIGKKYTERSDFEKNKFKGTETKETYTTSKGLEINLPIYYRNKAYTEEEKEKLWLQKLDKNERWICGEKIDMNDPKGEEKYFKLLEYYRAKNKKFGFGDDSKNWEQKRYENQIRNLKTLERIKNVSQSPRARITPAEDLEKKSSTDIIKPINYENLKNIW